MSRPAPRQGDIQADKIGELARLRFRGHMTNAVIRGALPEMRRLLGEGVRGVVFDGTAITSFDADVGMGGGELLTMVREGGVRVAVVAVTSGGVRMIAAAVSFAARLPLEMVGSHDEAVATALRLLQRTGSNSSQP